MTYNELRSEVCALGFEPDIESEERLLFATNRAMNIIFTERPLYKTLSLSKPQMLPVFKTDSIEHKGSETLSLDVCGKSYSFITSGTGGYTVQDSYGTEAHEFSANEKVHKGFLHGNAKIEFFGEYFYTVYSFAVFDELYGESENDIPLLDGFYEYDVKQHAPDFLSYISSPEDELGNSIPGAEVSAGTMSIPTDYFGRIFLKYKAAPKPIGKNGDESLVLPDGCEHLLPLLVSAYVWLDDDTDKAEYYMMLYRDGMAAVRAYNRSAIDSEYTVKDGWA